jgi:hypothetical protein
MHFEEQTIKVIIDESKCVGCKTHACAAGCKLFDRGILVIKDGKPALAGDAAFARRVGTECLACEYWMNTEESMVYCKSQMRCVCDWWRAIV